MADRNVKVDDLLSEYRAKRDFSRTAEPDHVAASRDGDQPTFVVQKHDATRLHYDFRLEWEGVPKSWAVTRGPSYDPAEKRLAVQTEDHPLAYGGFEGVIPKDEYGGGTVMLWDHGTWEPVEDFGKGLKDGKLVFKLRGERLIGEWTLVRMKRRPGEKRDNWLMIKHKEPGFKPPRFDVLKKFEKSVSTGRTMPQIAKGGRTLAKSDLTARKPEAAPVKATGPKAKGKVARPRKAPMPAWREPQLATLVTEAPDGDEWLSEMKYDGYRALIAIAGGKSRIYTRSGLDWTAKFPTIAEAAARLDTNGTLLDGEIVAFDAAGKTDFSTLQQGIKAGGRDLSCFVFDLIEHDGEDISRLPLVERKHRLETIVGEGSAPLVFSSHVEGRADAVLTQMCAAGYEGIVAKRADASYASGRARSWVKVKCARSQEFVIGGYKPSTKKDRAVASVLIGVNDGGKFIYKGRVGAFETGTLADIERALSDVKTTGSPFEAIPADARRSKFVKPELVVEVGFAEFTSDGVVRHGVLKGLREDKAADDVVLEKPVDAAETGEGSMSAKAIEHDTRDRIAGIKLSHPDKVLYLGDGVTKADLAAHYERVAERMLPHVGKRLVSLVRCPDGIGGERFFQKHGGKGFPKEFKRYEVEESDGKTDTYLGADTLAALVAGVQFSTLEYHIWGSRTDRLEQPDRLVFDLDPDEGLAFADVKSAAVDVRDRLAGIGLQTVPMVTGGKGVHVIAPLARRAEWPEVKGFAHAFAKLLGEEAPDRYVANMAKAKRKGRIFVDYLRNERGATAIAPYSTRARAGAPVATPISWDELASLEAANTFRLPDMEKRLAMADPWTESYGWKQAITKKMTKQVIGD